MLDLKALDPSFARAFGDASARQTWFAQLLQLALVATVTDAYADFSTLGKAALQMTATRRNVQISDERQQQILGMVRQLPPHPEVPGSLQMLQQAGLRLAALTNSAPDAAEAQLSHAGLRDYFEQVLSVDAVRQYKPAAAVYHMAAERLGVTPAQLRLIAAHGWDVAGALRAGCAAAFVARPDRALDPLAPAPDIIGPELRSVAQQILQREQPSP